MTSTRAKRAEVVVVGYGNTLRSDDGFGPAVAERLAARLMDERIRIYVRQLLTVELVADLEYAGLCVLVDAATTEPVGVLSCHEVTPEPTEPATLGHELKAASLVGLTQQLTGHVPRCILVSAGPRTMELGEGLSSDVAGLVEPAVEAILARVATYFTESVDGAAGAF